MSHTQSATAPAESAPDAEPEVSARDTWAVRLVLLAAFMVLADVSIMNITAPAIQQDLHADFGQIQLMVAGYQAAYAAVLVTGGRLGDIFGRRQLFVIGSICFTLASAACGLAGSPGQLISFRVLQGASAALLYPQVIATIQIVLPPARRMAALGTLGAVMGIATIAGPLGAGGLIEADVAGLDWRPIFLINIPIGLVLVVAGLKLMPTVRNLAKQRLDLGGMVLSVATLLSLIVPLTVGRAQDWPTWSWVLLALCPLPGVLFVLLQRNLGRSGGSPLVPASLWADRAFRGGALLYLVFFSAAICFFLYYAVLLEYGYGFSPFRAALSAAPYAVGTMASSLAGRKLIPSWGARRVAVTGACVCAAGTLTMLPVVHLVQESSVALALVPSLVVTGAGMGMVIAPLLTLVLSGIRSTEAGAAAGLLSTAQQIGSALGVLVMGWLFLLPTPDDALDGARASQLTTGLGWGLVFETVVFLISAALIAKLSKPAVAGQ
ncbi:MULTISPECIES: MFS transporter [unclassified Streptomyces]|uniref:MFS transporter n=1 Tax=Streptomyces sp. NBC_00060 TaxID=2975636 RepID=A0AAU2H854_9ACTN